MVSRGSAAWVVAIVAPLAVFVGAMILTVVDPLMQTLFSSALWSSQTSYGTSALAWQKAVWTFWPVVILVGLLFLVWIETRQPT